MSAQAGLVTPDPERLVEMLSAPAHARGADARAVTLTVLAVGMVVLGVPASLRRGFLSIMGSEDTETTVATGRVFAEQAAAFPYLRGHLGPIADWLSTASASQVGALRGAYRVLSGVDLPACVEDPRVGGDLLGPVYSVLRSRSEKSGHGAYYTPADLCRLMAQLTPVNEGQSVHEPACGSAAMVVAQARQMRTRGQCPETVRWVLQDIDPTAVALAGINLSALGLPLVELHCGNSLTTSI